MRKNNKIEGFSLVEMLIVIGLFSVISVVAAQSLFSSLKGASKTDASSRVRENLDFALQIIERHIRNAKSVICTSSQRIDYVDADGNPGSFYYIAGSGANPDSYVASASAQTRLTNSNIVISNLTFSCLIPALGNVPTAVTATLTGTDKLASGGERSTVTTSLQILLRTY